ncbi:hypothetical protein L7F22_068630 [Adiantum nelumboides]|nr:hypothetical protein [Adiantum nelumboides]
MEGRQWTSSSPQGAPTEEDQTGSSREPTTVSGAELAAEAACLYVAPGWATTQSRLQSAVLAEGSLWSP